MNGRRIALLLSVALCAPPAFAQAPPAKPAKPAKPAVSKEPAVAPGTEAVVETAKGKFTIRLLPELAPRHAALFVKTARAGAYDGTTFHRIIQGGIIQGGDPLTKDPAKASLYGTGGLGSPRPRSSPTGPSCAGRSPRCASPRAPTAAGGSSSS